MAEKKRRRQEQVRKKEKKEKRKKREKKASRGVPRASVGRFKANAKLTERREHGEERHGQVQTALLGGGAHVALLRLAHLLQQAHISVLLSHLFRAPFAAK